MVNATNLLRIHGVGDSITSLLTGPAGNYLGAPGGLIDRSRAAPISYGAAPTINYIPAKLGQTVQPYSPLPQLGRRQVITAYGVGGRTVSGLAADLQASIYNWKPNIVILEIGTNDFGGSTDVTPGGVFQTQYSLCLDGIFQNLPGCKVLCLTPPIRSEAWVAAGPHLADGLDTWAGLTRLQELCSGTSTVGTFRTLYPSFCELVDLITPAFAYERIMQPVAGTSVTPFELTQDSLHPSVYLGKIFHGTTIMQHINWS